MMMMMMMVYDKIYFKEYGITSIFHVCVCVGGGGEVGGGLRGTTTYVTSCLILFKKESFRMGYTIKGKKKLIMKQILSFNCCFNIEKGLKTKLV